MSATTDPTAVVPEGDKAKSSRNQADQILEALRVNQKLTVTALKNLGAGTNKPLIKYQNEAGDDKTYTLADLINDQKRIASNIKDLVNSRKRATKNTRRQTTNKNFGFNKVNFFDNILSKWLNDPRTIITLPANYNFTHQQVDAEGNLVEVPVATGSSLQSIITCTSSDQVNIGNELVSLANLCSTGTLAAYMTLYVSLKNLKGVQINGAVDANGAPKLDFRLWRPDENINHYFGPLLKKIGEENKAKGKGFPDGVYPNGTFMQLFTRLSKPLTELSEGERMLLEQPDYLNFAIQRVNADQQLVSQAVKAYKLLASAPVVGKTTAKTAK